MKFNRSMLGWTIRKSALEPYSRYTLKFLDSYKAEGVAIDAITIQNEVDTTVDGRYPACQWAQEDEILYVRKFLGPLLRKSNCPTKIWILDHNFDLWGRALAELSDPAANEFIDGVAWHGYGGEVTGMTQAHNAFPQKSAYFTEGGPRRDPELGGASHYSPLTGWAYWAEWANSVFRNWSRSITMWNLALDENGTPYIGHRDPNEPSYGPSTGVVVVDNETHKVTRTARFWGLAHYSKHVRRGAKVFETDGVADNTPQTAKGAVSHVGFRNPDGSFVVVLTNRGTEKRIQLVLGLAGAGGRTARRFRANVAVVVIALRSPPVAKSSPRGGARPPDNRVCPFRASSATGQAKFHPFVLFRAAADTILTAGRARGAAC